MTRAAQRRVLVGRLFHESHAFSPFVTRESEFAVMRGADLLAEARASGTTLGGIVRQLDRLDARLVPSVSASAPPSGLVDHEFYRSMKAELIDAVVAATPDAIALELHGAMGTTDLADVEGDLLTALRAAVGPDVVIGVGLDLHGHLTPAMLAAADFCIACKANPHSDVVECGEKVAAGVMSALEGSFDPVSTLVKVLMTLPGAMETTGGPLKALHEEALAASSPKVWDISLYNVYRALDDVDMGQAVCIVTNGDDPGAARLAMRLGQAFWSRRAEFKDDLLEIGDALDLVARKRGRERFVLADMGDRVLAGAPGDSISILAATLAHPAPLKAAIPLTDAETVVTAQKAGAGAEVELAVGGKLTPGFAPLAVRARVARLSDGNFRMRGPYRGGEWTALGPCAVLDIGGRVSLLVTSKPGFTHDPEAFESNGISLVAQDFIVVKSGYHFELNFKDLATPLLVRSPGIGYYTKGLTTWKRGRFWPEHDVGEAPFIGPQTFHRRFRASPGAGDGCE